jgi:hypothetical protein
MEYKTVNTINNYVYSLYFAILMLVFAIMFYRIDLEGCLFFNRTDRLQKYPNQSNYRNSLVRWVRCLLKNLFKCRDEDIFVRYIIIIVLSLVCLLLNLIYPKSSMIDYYGIIIASITSIYLCLLVYKKYSFTRFTDRYKRTLTVIIILMFIYFILCVWIRKDDYIMNENFA